jgi:16S rRNA (cytosine967-C5)-methyltransferase
MNVTDRQRAVQLLRRIEHESAFAAPLLTHESGFVRTLVLGVLRWRSRLDFAIDAFAKGRIEPEIRDLLRVGAYQLLFMDVAKYAAVSETVELAPKRARGFVNAILRRIAEGKAPEPKDLATRTAHPEWLVERWTRNYGSERAARIAAANQELSYPDVFTDVAPGNAEASRLVPGMWKLKGSSAEVAGYALDEGSALVATIAAATSDDILDLAAAPGGKSVVMRARGAHVVSNDVSLSRLRAVGQAILPVRKGEIACPPHLVVSDGRRPPFNRRFRTVLLDAPCSATGTIRKNPELKWRLQESDLPQFAALQRELLASAAELAAETIVYSTCSLEPEENDDIVRNVTGFGVIDALPFAPDGAKPWIEQGVLRLTPDSGADGFTAFVLQRRTTD